jgi:hypothetical protein
MAQEKRSSSYGGPFTPKGDIRFLVIYAGFENNCNDRENSIWPNTNISQGVGDCKTYPLYYKDLFYSDYSQFKEDADDFTISNFYYQMSRHHPRNPPLRIVADIFPERINIKGNSENNWEVFNQIQLKYPNFDWSKYDQRKNDPNFLFDNSKTGPDHVIDYVVIIYRKAGSGGYANTSSFTFIRNINGIEETYKVSSMSGFTITSGMSDVTKLFHHELAHTLYNCPHFFYANNVCGNYFYASNGWGMMAYGEILSTCNAWESWYLGWTELDDQHDLRSYKQNGIYTLRDFATTGDAIRIKLPFCNQYLWIENHSGLSKLDQRKYYELDGTDAPIPKVNMGLFMFVENVSDDRSQLLNPLSLAYANGLKALHANGNYDYEAVSSEIDPHWFRNRVVDFRPVLANPTSAHNDLSIIRSNYDFDTLYRDKIIYGTYTNNTYEGSTTCGTYFGSNTRQEAMQVIKKNGVYTYDVLGTTMAFGNGLLPEKIGTSYNPVIINHQKLLCPDQLEPILLNGISITILSQGTTKEFKLDIRFDDTKIERQQRFTGNVMLKDIENAAIDLHILPGKSLTIDKSGSPNRFTQGELVNGQFEYPDFINPSILTVDSNAVVVVESRGSMSINSGTTLRIKSGGTLIVKGKGKLKVAKDSYLCVEPGATVKLEAGKKNLKMKGKYGVNSKLKLGNVSCH